MANAAHVNEVELNDADIAAQVVGAPFAQGLRLHRGSRADDSYHDGNELDGVEQQPLSETASKWARVVVLTCCGDFVGSTVIMFVAFKYAYRDNGVSLYCVGILAVSHLLSSVLLILRFVDELLSRSSNKTLRERRLGSLRREQGIGICMALVMLASSCGLLFKAFRKIRLWEEWYSDVEHRKLDEEIQHITAWLAWTGFLIYLLQAVFRFVTSYIVKISVVTHGWVASFVTFIFMLVLGAAAKNESEWSWKAEPIAAIVLVCVTLVEAIRIIFSNIDDMETRLMEQPLV
eukprot:TRINITY_DN16281_c0_g2_i2.p1 TRINITY_DN16281_c0_g2~~TRINITY_DN16281_c0_g2_i2.p1  ORF type:complete len:290 (+),score=61.34 TRINITY_DN16281_c0_g2_i2:73-942(+)